LHGLAQLVVLDELSGGLHGGEQGGIGVAARGFGFLAQGLDLERRDGLAVGEPRELLVGSLVVVGAGALIGAELVVDAAPTGDEKDFAAGAEDILGARDGDGGL